MADWSDIYRSLLHRRIDGVVWMPITADTPQLAAELAAPSFSFSGAAFLRFEGAAVQLSWRQSGDRYVLVAGEEALWLPHVLDRVQASAETPWGDLIGSTLVTAEMFSAAEDPSQQVVGVRHHTTGGSFWIATGGPEFVGDGDDLWVGAECEPPNRNGLISVGAVS